ncbi:bifunctional 4-hydroxy-2-oxoglutarate aldolase/2-dehydro-3-deoxy-phosphogluconate aldolase [Solibacillus sp. R5-41]|uniref:bifunctional 4-hydroxy-2-oxoglutarate aldolase/2-dehydro-3-deoxy-phosphogluconate aldolase n=1 Tax=Solibacillus sp. R5-41 TaxID=2048654 RepID=UPI0012FE3860|nr:bifunctional 4-hydroxy-2-oxoglutarate aldolase/2-dehydro-3-deoxy-phosphogluconate aldolase [Solibacillus sp. R5-41]
MMNTLEHLKKYPIISILRRLPQENCLKAVQALYEGGIRSVEITADSDDILSTIGEIKMRYPSMKVGAGTVLSVDMAEQLLDCRVDFMLSPVVNKTVIQKVVMNNCIMIPGAFTPTEVLEAYEAGAQIIKLFPAHFLGSKFIKDLSGPLPFIPCAPTGGIDSSNILEYLEAGAHCLGVSSAFPTHSKTIGDNEYQEIVRKALEITAIVRKFQEG